jgi:hypothetical protein
MGRIPRFGEVCLLLNTNNNTQVISYLDSPDFDFGAYPFVKQFDEWTTYMMIYNACKWFKPYIGKSELTPVYIHALAFMDRIITDVHVDPMQRIQIINKLKIASTLCPEHIPLSVAKLDVLLEEEATARLQKRKAFIIQSRWREIIVNPYHVACQRRLMRELGDMVEVF